MTPQASDLVERLTDFHKRLSLCFEGKTREARPRRPWPFEPQFADLETLLDAGVEVARAKPDTIAKLEADNARLREALIQIRDYSSLSPASATMIHAALNNGGNDGQASV